MSRLKLRSGPFGFAAASSILALAATVCGAHAHTFWMEPRVEADRLKVEFLVGDHGDRSPWNFQRDRIESLLLHTDEGATSLAAVATPAAAEKAGYVVAPVPREGVVMVSFASTPANIVLAQEKFESYARDEGVTPILDALKSYDKPAWSENYSRRAKTIVGRPSASDGRVFEPIGHELEITPNADVYRDGAAAAFRVWRSGEPMAGVTVFAQNLDDINEPSSKSVSDENGYVAFDAMDGGAWRLGSVWSDVEEDGDDVQVTSYFSSLTLRW
ncbi:MAG: DUF4198 domain-containing protein [Parvularculaceae bacterium]